LCPRDSIRIGEGLDPVNEQGLELETSFGDDMSDQEALKLGRYNSWSNCLATLILANHFGTERCFLLSSKSVWWKLSFRD